MGMTICQLSECALNAGIPYCDIRIENKSQILTEMAGTGIVLPGVVMTAKCSLCGQIDVFGDCYIDDIGTHVVNTYWDERDIEIIQNKLPKGILVNV